jgi:hypothetical protein
MKALAGVLALTGALAVAGCGGGGASASHPAGTGTPGSMPPVPATASPRTPDLPTVGKLLVSYGRQGGVAGVNDQLLVNTDGTYQIVRVRPKLNRKGRLSAADLAHLRKVLSGSGFAKLPAVEPARGNDLFTYQIVYAHHQVIAQDGGMVPALRPVVAELGHLLASYGK